MAEEEGEDHVETEARTGTKAAPRFLAATRREEEAWKEFPLESPAAVSPAHPLVLDSSLQDCKKWLSPPVGRSWLWPS